ncbi:MSMEG_0565 family glycosyltransferase [Gluconacetobacter takamatsuzukensis]|uniref:MSMEG_0565 family glycosyltransferase n=1 Tax=Gluconacetobacter takamatsuzukensis TaxID=1286190 RepID=A0A7W4KDF9_9PROT|nr:MSMEG_0565 family glycosyltransferase [Gluconacetobacter takamatsuzukensis]MBB2204934.1 MSMEG_0565 family glycosyltransferase [Gluconacetobacter takamatsuzukensis]
MTLSIAILTHSTNPRGGVVHGMALAEALCDAGHEATLIAPDTGGGGFFRQPRCAVRCIPVPEMGDLAARVECHVAAIREALRGARYDVLHAQDPIGANALADLVAEGDVSGFARTVHHLDSFSDPGLAFRQARGVRAATALFTVSALWERTLLAEWGRAAPVVGNGVDPARFSPLAGERDGSLRSRHGLPADRKLILSVGGVERRKNTLGLLEAFVRLRAVRPDVHLVIAGGASLLDHSACRADFAERLAASGQSDAVTVTGPVAEADMAAFYRQAAVLAYPSLSEGFGLCPVEALACGTPVIVPEAAPFTEHLRGDEALWCVPHRPDTLLHALHDALRPASRAHFGVVGPAVARRFCWHGVAARHIPAYRRLAALPRAGGLQEYAKNA